MINRNAIIVKPKDPFKVWIDKTCGDFEIRDYEDFNIYLIPEIVSRQALDIGMVDFWDIVFDEELNLWCSEEKLWPKNRTYKMFLEWFEVNYYSVIHDLVDGELKDIQYNPAYRLPSTQEHRIFSKIISGGQTGADQGALDAALKLGHLCGGWCPKGRKSESGRIPDKYPLQEHTSASYPARTEANVRDSNGTLIFTYCEPTGGTALTVELAKKLNKPVYIFDFNQEAINPDPAEIFEWGAENNVYTLNVAGPRESGKPGTQDLVESVMVQVLEFAREAYPVVGEEI